MLESSDTLTSIRVVGDSRSDQALLLSDDMDTGRSCIFKLYLRAGTSLSTRIVYKVFVHIIHIICICNTQIYECIKWLPGTGGIVINMNEIVKYSISGSSNILHWHMYM